MGIIYLIRSVIVKISLKKIYIVSAIPHFLINIFFSTKKNYLCYLFNKNQNQPKFILKEICPLPSSGFKIN